MVRCAVTVLTLWTPAMHDDKLGLRATATARKHSLANVTAFIISTVNISTITHST